MRKMHYCGAVLLTIAMAGTALTPFHTLAQGKAKPAAASQKVQFRDVKLKNGLRVLLVEDRSAPVISLALIYDVGSRNEKKGRTGFAHLFEHMMFQGSENIGKSEHFILIDSNGGQMNGTTNEERTLYFETLPANQLDLMLFLEADRMKSLDISKENLDNQRNAVQEERRLRVDNQPYGQMFERFGETMYDNFNYKHSVIGSMEDLNAATVDDVREFFRIYYAPNNAVLALVGDFRTDDALRKIRKAFESIPAQPRPPAVDATEPVQTAERRFTYEDPLAQLPLIQIGYKGILGNTPDAYAMQLLANILGGGQSSRLFQKLVRERQLALSAGSFANVRRGPGAFQINANLVPGKKTEEVEAVIYEEIAKLQQQPVEDWELEKARQFAKRGAINSRASSLGLAINLAEAAVAYNDPNLVNTRIDKIMAVTKEDIMRAAKEYLQPARRTVGIAMPKAAGAAGAPSSGR
ncbi:MAG: insulinase family protein [Acidobacteria bacterium]|nr:insulinase family protein [Acidobacteriota bacterium]MCW5970532.1 insulinase family protein [Blastocatellales bacterium]